MEKLQAAFVKVFGYDPEKTGHKGSEPVTAKQLFELFAALGDSDEEESEPASE